MSSVIARFRRDPGVALLALALLASTVLYAATVGRGLVDLDDVWLIQDNWIVQDASWSSLSTILFDLDSPRRFTLSPEYLPVRDLSIMVDFALWGDWYGGFHLTNILLYLISIVVWFAVFAELGVDRKVAGLTVLLWALHPAHAESVAWLSERKGLLGVAFAGISALAYVRFRGGRNVGWLVLAMLTTVLAVWSKAIAAFAIAALAGLELALPAKRVSWRRSLSGLGALAVVGALAFGPVLMLASSSQVVGTEMRAPAGRLEMVFGTLGFYVRLAAMAIRNAISYPISTAGPSVLDVILGVLALGVLTAIVIIPRRHRFAVTPEVRAGGLFMLITWLPVSHLILPLQMVFVADRYLLIPTLGLALAGASALLRISSRRARTGLIVILCLAQGLRTLDAQSTWKDSTALWDRAVVSNPADGTAWSFYAEALATSGDPQGAFVAVVMGLQHSRAPRLVMRQALFVLASGRRQLGAELMRTAALAGEPVAMANLSLLLLEDGKHEDAVAWARRAVTIRPYNSNGQRMLGKALLAAHRPAEALPPFISAYELEPKNPANRYNLALAYLGVGQPAAARVHLEACRDAPVLARLCRKRLSELGH